MEAPLATALRDSGLEFLTGQTQTSESRGQVFGLSPSSLGPRTVPETEQALKKYQFLGRLGDSVG